MRHWRERAQDEDPYVRKTAAVCVAKLYDINPDLVDDRGFLDMLRVRALDAREGWCAARLKPAAGACSTCSGWAPRAPLAQGGMLAGGLQGRSAGRPSSHQRDLPCPAPVLAAARACAGTLALADDMWRARAGAVLRRVCSLQDMLSDANPMVVANALAALQEIQEVSGKDMLQMSSHTLFKLLAALNECTEWGQVSRPAAADCKGADFAAQGACAASAVGAALGMALAGRDSRWVSPCGQHMGSNVGPSLPLPWEPPRGAAYAQARAAQPTPRAVATAACPQVFILDSLVGYETSDPKDAEKIVERVLPRLQHVNSAVVLSAVKVRPPPPRAPHTPARTRHQAVGAGGPRPAARVCGAVRAQATHAQDCARIVVRR